MAIALPTVEVSWSMNLFNRIAYASVNQVCGDVIYTVVKRLINQGWTVKGSCDGTTGAMDGVDRWTDVTKARVRFNGSAGAQSWFVLTDADGANVVFTYNAAVDDVYSMWWSPTGVAAAAGTPAQEPTATDKILNNKFFTTTPGTIVGTTTSGDRLVSIWTDSNHSFRVAVAHNNGWKSLFGKERYTAGAVAAGITLHAGFMFYINGGLTPLTSGARSLLNNPVATGGVTDQWRCTSFRSNGGGIGLELSREVRLTGENGNTGAVPGNWEGTTMPMAGGTQYMMKRFGLFVAWDSAGAGSQYGSIGKIKDWWMGKKADTDGNTYGSNAFIVVNGSGGLVWPLDGATVPVMN